MDGLTFKQSMAFDYGIAAEMRPGIARLVANNPGPFTFKGTNTYLVGTATLAIIDPGPDDPAHLQAILEAANGRRITHILATHAHRDHVDGIPALQAATGAKVCAMQRKGNVPLALDQTPQGREYINLDLVADLDVADGDTLEGEDWRLRAIHTPGHAPDHLCFAHEQTGAVFCGDHVMAWNTSVVAPPEGRMSDYIASLEKLLKLSATIYLPGHGGRILEPQRTVKAYLLHRRWREQAILKAIVDGAACLSAIVPVVYPHIASNLIPAATLTVLAHVEMLVERGQVAAAGPLTADQLLRAV